jgi:hypothetical protein
MEIIEDVHHRQPMAFDLGAAAVIDDSNQLGIHGNSPGVISNRVSELT